MNQMTHPADSDDAPLQAGPVASNGSDAPATAPASAPKEKPTLNAADAQLIYKALVLNSAPVSRRSDLVELNNRIVKLFGTLNQGLSEMQTKKAAADREALSARLDAMETSVNRMEGAFRIEFEPLLRQTLSEVVAEQSRPRRSRFLPAVGLMCVAAAALTLGVLFHIEIQTFVSDVIGASTISK